MIILTGLGNPTSQYKNTPHNCGYMFVDMLKEYLIENSNLDISKWKTEKKIFLSDICKIKKGGELIGILQKPLTYMNNSGIAVNFLLKKYPASEYILVHDDLDIPLGKYKVQRGKSPKGHRGVLSVENVIKNTDFLRVRLGIDNRGRRLIEGEEYVLMPYSKKELEILKSVINVSMQALFRESGMF
jgi:peptidyl-tRNA hydrolase, PTH1 family